MGIRKDNDADAATGISRRKFAVFSAAAAAAAGYAGTASAAAASAGNAPSVTALPVQERRVAVNTPDGAAEALFFHPAEGRHPGVVLWSDPAGLRSTTAAIARDLAGAGLAVLMVDPFARAGTRLQALEEHHINGDSRQFTAWLGEQAEVAEAAEGYVTRAVVPEAPLLQRGSGLARSAYLLATPRNNQALTAKQHRAIERAVAATDRLVQSYAA